MTTKTSWRVCRKDSCFELLHECNRLYPDKGFIIFEDNSLLYLATQRNDILPGEIIKHTKGTKLYSALFAQICDFFFAVYNVR